MDQFIVGPTGRTALGLPLVKPEPHDGGVVLTWTEITPVRGRGTAGQNGFSQALTETAHQPLVSNAGDDVGVLLGARVVFGLQDAVGIL